MQMLPLPAIWRIVSEVDLNEIRQNAEQPFQLVIAGDNHTLVVQLASLLSGNGDSFVHPWLTLLTMPLKMGALERLGTIELVILVISQPASIDNARTIANDLVRSKVPVLVLFVGATAGAAESAVLPRAGIRTASVASLDEQIFREVIAPEILDAFPPELLLALARQLTGLRGVVYEHLVQDTAQANAAYAFSTGVAEIIPILNVPLNVSDLMVLTKNQLIMGYKIALAAGKEGTPRDLIGEVVSVIGGGFLFRQLARELVGLIPVWGVLPKVAIAYAGTWVIGQTIIHWATEGRLLPSAALKSFYADALDRGRKVAREILAQRTSLHAPSARTTDHRRVSVWHRLRRYLPLP